MGAEKGRRRRVQEKERLSRRKVRWEIRAARCGAIGDATAEIGRQLEGGFGTP